MAPCRTIRLNLFLAPPRWWAITALCAAALSACGGGSDTAAPSQAVAGPLASGTTTLENLVVLDDTVGSAVDRKSTRLNSSHLVISYAVFCLKKKKTLLTAHVE